MTRRSSASGGPVKARRRKTAEAKLRNRPKGASPLSSSAASQETEIARLSGQLNEALEQQTATSEVLQIISSSPGDLQPVFATMLENGVRICDATFGNIYLLEGDALKIAASLNTPAAFAEVRGRSSFRPGPKNPISRMIATKQVVHVTDVAASEAYAERDPVTVAAVELGGVRSGHRPGSQPSCAADRDIPARIRSAVDRTAPRDGADHQSADAARGRRHDRPRCR